MKIVEIIVDCMPSSCKQCDFVDKSFSSGNYCKLTGCSANYQKRPNSCKLKTKE